MQQLAAELAHGIADAGADDKAGAKQEVDRKVESREPADRENQIGRSGVVAQQHDHADEQRQHRQHHCRRAGLFLRHRITGAEAEEAGQHGKILVEGIDREHRSEPADQHQFQEQAEHRHQNDRPDFRLPAHVGIIGLERRRHQPDLAVERLGEPAPAEQRADRGDTKPDPKQAGGKLGRADGFELEQTVDRDRGVDDQEAAQRQAEDADKAAVGIMGCDHGLGPGAFEALRSRVSRS